MHVATLELTDFRCYQSAHLELPPAVIALNGRRNLDSMRLARYLVVSSFGNQKKWNSGPGFKNWSSHVLAE